MPSISINNKVKTYLDNNTLILRDFNTTLSSKDRSSKHNISKETRALKDTLDQMSFTCLLYTSDAADDRPQV